MNKLFLVSIILLTILNSQTASKVSKKTIIVGHRGASGYEPENTLRSFKRAIKMGAPMIELDVFQCKSGEIVVMHDETVDRTTNGKGYVKDLNWGYLKNLDAGSGEHVPLLSQVFDLVNKKVTINIEIKDPEATKSVANLIREYIKNKNWSTDNFIVTSFNLTALKDFHKYCPEVKTGALFEDKLNNYIELTKQIGAQYLVLDYKLVTKNIINQAHESNLSVFVYTVNDKKLAKNLALLGVDGIITNYPDILS